MSVYKTLQSPQILNLLVQKKEGEILKSEIRFSTRTHGYFPINLGLNQLPLGLTSEHIGTSIIVETSKDRGTSCQKTRFRAQL